MVGPYFRRVNPHVYPCRKQCQKKARGVSSFARDHQKFSICHMFWDRRLQLSPAIARPVTGLPKFRDCQIRAGQKFCIEGDIQQCTVPFKIMPRKPGVSFHLRASDAIQALPSFHDQITRSARGCGAEVDRSLVGTIKDDDDCSFRTIGGKLQLHSASICADSKRFPLILSNPNVF
jgi:hypothetical protein